MKKRLVVAIALAMLLISGGLLDRSLRDETAIEPSPAPAAGASNGLAVLGPIGLIGLAYTGSITIDCLAGTNILSADLTSADLPAYASGLTFLKVEFDPDSPAWVDSGSSFSSTTADLNWLSFTSLGCDLANSPAGTVEFQLSDGETYVATIILNPM